MKRSERLAMELEDVIVSHNRMCATLRMLAARVLEGHPGARDMARDILLESPESAVLLEIRPESRGVAISGEHWSIQLFAESFGKMLQKPDGTYWNNLETKFSSPSPSGPRMVVTIQRVGSETPGEQREKALARVAELEAIVRAVAEREPLDRGGNCVYCLEYVGGVVDDWHVEVEDWPRERLGKRQYDHKPDCLWLKTRKALGMEASNGRK